MIDLSLDRHDFVSAIEGFAHDSHLRQHVWHEIVFRNIPQILMKSVKNGLKNMVMILICV